MDEHSGGGSGDGVVSVVLTVVVAVATDMVWGIDITRFTEFDGFACSEFNFFSVLRCKNEVERKKEKNVRSNTVSTRFNLLFKNTEQVDCSQLNKWHKSEIKDKR